jgi:hypothetical protein
VGNGGPLALCSPPPPSLENRGSHGFPFGFLCHCCVGVFKDSLSVPVELACFPFHFCSQGYWRLAEALAVLPLAHVVYSLAPVIIQTRGQATDGGVGNGGLLALHKLWS